MRGWGFFIYSESLFQFGLLIVLGLFQMNSYCQVYPVVDLGADTVFCDRESTGTNFVIGGSPTVLYYDLDSIEFSWKVLHCDNPNLDQAAFVLNDTNSLNPVVASGINYNELSLSLEVSIPDSCCWVDTINIILSREYTSLVPAIVVLMEGDTVQLSPSVYPIHSVEEVRWSPSTEMNDSTELYPLVWPSSSRFYYSTLIDEFGCEYTAEPPYATPVELRVIPLGVSNLEEFDKGIRIEESAVIIEEQGSYSLQQFNMAGELLIHSESNSCCIHHLRLLKVSRYTIVRILQNNKIHESFLLPPDF
jgi:hypothetical protein